MRAGDVIARANGWEPVGRSPKTEMRCAKKRSSTLGVKVPQAWKGKSRARFRTKGMNGKA